MLGEYLAHRHALKNVAAMLTIVANMQEGEQVSFVAECSNIKI